MRMLTSKFLNLLQNIVEIAEKDYFKKEKIAGVEAIRHFEKSIMLQIIDHHWRSHLSALIIFVKELV